MTAIAARSRLTAIGRPTTTAWAVPLARTLRPGAVYLAGQAAVLGMLMLAAHAHRRGLYGLLISNWDGKDFLLIAQHGYDHTVTAGHDRSVAFFPGYPLLLRGMHAVTHLSVGAVAIPVSLACGVAFAYGLTRLVPGRTGLVLVALVAVSPMSIILMMAYSEALFCALAVWALVCMQERRWVTAAVLVAAAGLVRQSGTALVVALIVVVALARPVRWQAAVRPLAALAIAPVGILGYFVWADRFTGIQGVWFRAEQQWGSRFDLGHQTLRWGYRSLMYAPSVLDVATVAVLVAALALLTQSGWRRTPALAAYAAVIVAMDVLSAGVMSSKMRLLIPAFILLIPVARYIANQHPRRMALMLTGFGIAGGWYSAYALVMYGYAI